MPTALFSTLPDGRRLAYEETGAPDGTPVLAFHGLPGSRLQRHPDASIARAAGARLIHVDRPGFGRSSPKPRRRIADWPADVAALADALGLARFAVMGVSGGGPYAAACIAALGARITRAALVSSVGPPGSMRGRMVFPARLGFLLARRAPALLRPALALAAPLVVKRPKPAIDVFATRMSASDRAVLARPDLQAMFSRDLAESFHQGHHAFLQELELLASPWRLQLGAPACEVALWHGEDDRLIPHLASVHLAKALPGGELRISPGEGHFMVFDRWHEICRWIAA